MRSLFSGVSGLKNHQTRMDVIGNNIANVNTTGFKGSRVTFQDILSQTITNASSAQGTSGGTNAKQIGLGVGVASIDTDTSDGSVQSTGYNTDLCISGNGYFLLGDGDNTYYTRNGAFSFDASGNYVNSGGLKVQGWMADSTGTISSTGEVTDISVPVGQTMAATATTAATFTKNLSADGDTTATYTSLSSLLTALGLSSSSTGSAATDYTTVSNLTSGNSATLTSDTTKSVSYDGTTYTLTTSGTTATTSFAAYDSEGVKHTITGTFTKSTTANQWTFTATSTDGGTMTGGTGTITFDTSGKYSSSTVSDIVFTPSGGAAATTIALDFSALTQYSGDTTVTVDKNGNAAGSLSSVSIDSTGTIVGTFSNGLKQDLAQVALATFNNPGGLTKSGTSLYSSSNNSGEAQISTAGSGGAGSLTPSSLEMSNVSLSDQFSDMIITQRGFQANSKIITTSDEMLETLVGLKR
ncbi:MAG: flgE 2 [Firmicutes bacterium]|nr:flgE 2 [Bacillota bacterium]